MEILFRAKSKGDEMWRHGSIVSDKKGGYAIIQVRDNPISNGCANGWCFGVIPETVGQYIGSKDKNGTKVFFGDLVKAPSGNIFEVIWYDEEMRIALKRLDVIYNFNVALFEVIGNIHDNPELLK